MIKFIVTILVSFYFQIQPFWIYPEAQKVNCVRNMESWYNSKVIDIADLPLSTKIMAEQMEFYRDEADKRIERYCQ